MSEWRRSSYCANGACVEVADGCSTIDPRVLVRDGKSGDLSPRLSFTPAAWSTFLDEVKAGRRDRPQVG